MNLTTHRMVARAAPSRRYTRGVKEMTSGLQSAKGRARLDGPMPRPPKETKARDYPAKVSARLRELRTERKWSVKKLKDRLAEVGEPVPLSSLYAYELGKAEGGVDIPLNLVPAIAKAFGFKTPGGWLPAE